MQKLLNWLDSVQKYLIAGVILAIPIYPKFPFVKIPLTYVSIRFEDFLLGLLALVTFILILPKIKETFKNSIEQSILVFLAAGLVSLFSAVYLTQTVSLQLGFLHWVRRIEYLVPFFALIVSLSKNSRQKLNYYLTCLILALSVIIVYALGQRFLGWPVIATQNMEVSKGIALKWTPGSHINSTFAGHYDLASYLILVTPLFANLFFLVKDRFQKAISAFLVLGGTWLLAVSQSRISVVSFLLAISFSMFLIKKTKWIPVFLLIALTIFASSPDLRSRYLRVWEVGKTQIQKIMVLPISPVFAQEVEGVGVRVNSFEPTPAPVEVFEDRSSSIRFVVEWPRAIRAFLKNPLLGTGYSSISLATDNDYLRAIGEVGFIGFASFALLLFNLVKLALKGIKKCSLLRQIPRSFVAAYIAGLGGILINAVFIDVFEASKLAINFWLLTGIAVFLIRDYAEQTK